MTITMNDLKMDLEITTSSKMNLLETPTVTTHVDATRPRMELKNFVKTNARTEPTFLHTGEYMDWLGAAYTVNEPLFESQPMIVGEGWWMRVKTEWTRTSLAPGGDSDTTNTAIKVVLSAYNSSGVLISDFATATTIVNTPSNLSGRNGAQPEGTTPAGTQTVKLRVLSNAAQSDVNIGMRVVAGGLMTWVAPSVTVPGWTDVEVEVNELSGDYVFGPGGFGSVPTTSTVAMTAGQWAAVSAFTYSRPVTIQIEFLNASDAVLGTSVGARSGPTGSFVQNEVTGTATSIGQAPTGTTKARVKISYVGQAGNTNQWDKVSLITGTSAEVSSNNSFDATVGKGYENLLDNPSGATGFNAWTPGTGVTLEAPGNAYLRISGTGNNVYAESNIFEVQAGGWVSVNGEFNAETVYHDNVYLRMHWYDAVGTHIGYSSPSDYVVDETAHYSGRNQYDHGLWLTKVPANVYQAKLEVHTHDPFVRNEVMAVRFTSMAVLSGPSIAAVSGVPFDSSQIIYTNIIGGVSAINVDRAELMPGIMNIDLRGTAYDPKFNTDIREGNRLVFKGKDSLGNFKALFTGFITNISTEYPYNERPLVRIRAVDGVKEIGSKARAAGGATMQGLNQVLTGIDTAWVISATDGAYVQTHTIANGTYLDHIILARDTSGGLAFVDKDNVLRIFGPAQIPTAPVLTFTDQFVANTQSYFPGVTVGSGGDRLINVVTVKKLSGTTETTHGPYSNGQSVNDWGAYSEEIKIVGSVDPATWATGFLAKTATPQQRIEELSFPVDDAPSLNNLLKLDLYSPVAMVYTPTGLNTNYRIAGIRMNITPYEWIVDVEFMHLNGSPAA